MHRQFAIDVREEPPIATIFKPDLDAVPQKPVQVDFQHHQVAGEVAIDEVRRSGQLLVRGAVNEADVRE